MKFHATLPTPISMRIYGDIDLHRTQESHLKAHEFQLVLMQNGYHGIMIKESLKDQSILETMNILGKKVSGSWTLLRLGIEAGRIDEVVNVIKENLLVEDNVPYYAHFYRDEELIVVFPHRVFRVKTHKETWTPVVEYGLSKGIPRNQMDIKPCKLEEEVY